MHPEGEIVNRVALSGLVTFDLEAFYTPGERVVIDIKNQLYQGLILKEKDFREFIKTTDWSAYHNKHVALTCSADAIVPTWAYMLLTIALEPFAKTVIFGSVDDLETHLFFKSLSSVDWSQYAGARVVIKGCSNVRVPEAVYVEVTRKLKPVAAGLMFGEACSTVPLYKKSKAKET